MEIVIWGISLDIASLIAGAIVGIVAGFVVEFVMLPIASRDLHKEAANLRKLNAMILQSLERAGGLQPKYDENGEIIGLNIVIPVNAATFKLGTFPAKVTVTESPRDDSEQGPQVAE